MPCVRFGALFAALMAAACSPTTILGAIAPAAPGGETQDVAYASGPRHRMDIYAPAPGDTLAPVVVFFYGGGWVAGDRAKYRFIGRSLAACGVLAIIPDYRVWPETGFPGFLQDAATAVAAAQQIAARHGGDPERLFLMGHSAGAYIAAMLALDPTWLAASGLDAATDVTGAVGISGPYDFLPLRDPVLEQIFAGTGPRSQPITFASKASPPLLLLTGATDTTVEPGNSARLAARVVAAGGQAESIVYPNLGHVAALAAVAGPLRFLGPVRDDACRFLGVSRHAAPRTASHAPQPAAQWR